MTFILYLLNHYLLNCKIQANTPMTKTHHLPTSFNFALLASVGIALFLLLILVLRENPGRITQEKLTPEVPQDTKTILAEIGSVKEQQKMIGEMLVELIKTVEQAPDVADVSPHNPSELPRWDPNSIDELFKEVKQNINEIYTILDSADQQINKLKNNFDQAAIDRIFTGMCIKDITAWEKEIKTLDANIDNLEQHLKTIIELPDQQESGGAPIPSSPQNSKPIEDSLANMIDGIGQLDNALQTTQKLITESSEFFGVANIEDNLQTLTFSRMAVTTLKNNVHTLVTSSTTNRKELLEAPVRPQVPQRIFRPFRIFHRIRFRRKYFLFFL